MPIVYVPDAGRSQRSTDGNRMKPHEHTQGCTDRQLGPRQNILPMDEFDGIRRCALCGWQSQYPTIIRTVFINDPDTVSMRCADVVSCLRRRPRT